MRRWQPFLFRDQTRNTWLLLFVLFLYFAFSWYLYSFAVENVYGDYHTVGIAADSGAYFQLAGISGQGSVDQGSLINFGGSSLGPVIMAVLGRTQFGVACLNYLLMILTVWWAGLVPGVRRDVFCVLMAVEAQTLPTLMTLNKEILAIAGLVAFAAYIYSGAKCGKPRGSRSLLVASLILSLMARWEQAIIPLWYLAAEWRFSPVRGRPGRSLLALLLLLSAGWAAGIHVLHLNLAGFILQTEGQGWVSRFYSIQENGGFFLVALPKILMNVAGRWVQPGYFLHSYWDEDFGGNWQNQYIGFLSNIGMMSLLAHMFVRGRLRLRRPLIHLAAIYCICTALNPFIQHRYIYPAYVFLALEISRRRETLEPVPQSFTLPPLPRSYLPRSATSSPAA